jgi:hypothetical protein
MFLGLALKKTRLKTEDLQLLGKLPPTVKVLKAVVYQKQAIVGSLEQAATVWDLGDRPALYSGKEYSRLFKEITAALT